MRLSLFLFSLFGEAKRWLHSFKGNSLKTWDEVVEKFLKKYFPESKTAEGKAVMELIENIVASDHAILRDQTHIPTKRSLLKLSS